VLHFKVTAVSFCAQSFKYFTSVAYDCNNIGRFGPWTVFYANLLLVTTAVIYSHKTVITYAQIVQGQALNPKLRP
jgi:hypothetical protein